MTTTVEILEDKVIVIEVASGFPQGNGVPAGGTTGQALIKQSDGNFDADWSSVVAGSATWGSLNGTLADQTDLVAALADKNKTYVQDVTPGLDSDTGDIWFNSTTHTVQYNNSGTWVSPTLDAGQY